MSSSDPQPSAEARELALEIATRLLGMRACGSARSRGSLRGSRRRRQVVTTQERIEAAMNLLYERAVAMHESIERGDGATGWQDAKVRNILESLVRGEVMRG